MPTTEIPESGAIGNGRNDVKMLDAMALGTSFLDRKMLRQAHFHTQISELAT